MVIILIGFMGSGKTTLGRKLASQMRYEFIDADEAIEARYKLSIKEIFARFGETHFRKLEREFILGLEGKENIVLSTGGGMPCFGDHMELLNDLGTTFYLKRSPAELAHRLVNAKKPRPLIQGKDPEELPGFISALLAQREAFYLRAHHVLERDRQTSVYIQFLLQKQ